MFRRVDDIMPRFFQEELIRLATLDRNWLEWKRVPNVPGEPEDRYTCSMKHNSWTRKTWGSGGDAFGQWGLSWWLVDGPKVFRPTIEQCQALEQVEVRLTLSDYAQPYPAILIDLPEGRYDPITCVLCCQAPEILTFQCLSADHLNDIVTTIAVDGRPIEVSLQKYDADIDSPLGQICGKALRVALNSCLCLVNYGCHSDYLYPKEVVSDQRLAKENTERGERARYRVRTAPFLTEFNHEVVLHHTHHRNGNHKPNPTGREMESHWRRGHWAMQPYGPHSSLRKRILRKPILVRADKFIGESKDTVTTYTG